MYFLVDMCYLCLDKSNETVLKSLTDFDDDDVTFYHKLTTSLSNLVVGANCSEIKVCMKCCSVIREIYSFNNMCARNMTTYMKYKTLLNAQKNSKSELVKIELRNVDSIELELPDNIKFEIIESDDLPCLTDVNQSFEFPEMKMEIKDELLDNPGPIENPYNSENMVIITEELDIKLEDFPNYFSEGDFMNIVHHQNDFINRETTMKNSEIINVAEQILIKENQNTSTNINKQKIYKKQLHQKSNGNAQKQIYTDERTHACDICKKGFKSNKILNKHILIHTGKKNYVCHICNKSYGRSETLNTHKLIHTGERKHVCDICNKAFFRSTHLTRHKLIHTGKKKHACHVCNKSFVRSETLNAHKLIHTGEKKYVCGICNRSFTYSSTLNAHKLTHTGERKHVCDICNKAFIRSTHLTRHKLIHTGKKKYASHA